MGDKFTDDQLRLAGFLETSPGQWSKASAVAPRVSNPEPKPTIREALVSAPKMSKGSERRAYVRFTIARCGTLLDDDNAASSVKCILDALRYCGAIRDDAPGYVSITVEQRRVAKKAQEGTEIEIEYLPI